MTVGNDMDGALLIRDARELIESLIVVARATSGFVVSTEPEDWITLLEALNAAPAWVFDNEG